MTNGEHTTGNVIANMANISDLKIDNAPRKHSRRRSRWPWRVVFTVLLLAAGFAAYNHISQKTRSVELFSVPLETTALRGGFSAGGYLEVIPPGPLVVSATTDGRVKSLSVVEGQIVEEGEELARLDDSIHRLDREAKEAAVSLARAKLARLQAGFRQEEISQAKLALQAAEARLRNAETEYARSESLVKDALIPKRAYDTSKADLAVAQAEVAAKKSEVELRERGYRKEDIVVAQAELTVSESELARIKHKSDACVIKSPIRAVVLDVYVELGKWVSPTDQAERPGAILRLIDPKKIQAWVDVNQRDISRISIGQKVSLSTDSDPARQIVARVARIMPKANLQKNTVQVKIEISQPPLDLRPEMSVKVTFLPPNNDSPQPTIPRIPESALSRRGSTVGIFVVAEGSARFISVEIDEQSGGMVALRSGVSPGDQVILNPAGLSDGQAVVAHRGKQK